LTVDCPHQLRPALGQLVHDHLSLPLRTRQPDALQAAEVMGDQPLVAVDDPGQVADTRRLTPVKGERNREPGRIAKRFPGGGELPEGLDARKLLADPLGLG
jgi:hypothetical protein